MDRPEGQFKLASGVKKLQIIINYEKKKSKKRASSNNRYMGTKQAMPTIHTVMSHRDAQQEKLVTARYPHNCL